MNDQDVTEKLLMALRHPARRELLVALTKRDGPLSPKKLAEELRMPLAKVSYHARVLAGCEGLDLIDLTPKRGLIQQFCVPSDLVEHPAVKAALDSNGGTSADL